MSEDFPQDPSLLPPQEQAGEQPLQQDEQQSGHIDVSYQNSGEVPESPLVSPNASETPDSLEESARIASIDHDQDESSRVDEPKALEMAYSAKEDRDAAANTRREAAEDSELLKEVEDFYANSSEYQTDDEKDTARRALADKLKPVANGRKYSNDFLKKAYLDLAYDDEPKGTREQREESLDKFQDQRAEFAKKKDELADKVEELAGIIHDRPISEGYKEAHRGIELTPKDLVSLEITSDKTLAEVGKREELLDSKDLADLMKRGFNPNGKAGNNAPMNGHTAEWLAKLLSEVDADAAIELSYKYLQMTKNAEQTTLAQYVEFFRDGFKKVFIEPERKMALAAKSVVEDVRSGRASQ